MASKKTATFWGDRFYLNYIKKVYQNIPVRRNSRSNNLLMATVINYASFPVNSDLFYLIDNVVYRIPPHVDTIIVVFYVVSINGVVLRLFNSDAIAVGFYVVSINDVV